MEALTFGAPPMGGFALGVTAYACCCSVDSIRDVMAFPKELLLALNLMSSAPSPVSNEQLKEVSFRRFKRGVKQTYK